MMTTMHTPIAQRLRRIMAAGAVALLLASSLAPTAGARPRHPANSAVQSCMASNGDPYYFEFAGVWAVGCQWNEVLGSGGALRSAARARATTTDDTGAHTPDQGQQRDHKQPKHRAHVGNHQAHRLGVRRAAVDRNDDGHADPVGADTDADSGAGD